MTRIDFTRDRIQRQRRAARQASAPIEITCEIGSQTAAIIKGMGNNRKPEPLKRISPNSPEGRAIAARLTSQPP